VRYTKLVPANDLSVRDLLPSGATDEVLSLEKRVTEDVRVRSHLDELFGRHGLPDLVEERTVIDDELGCNNSLESLPVLKANCQPLQSSRRDSGVLTLVS
jgi:hypothetical protein